MVHGWTARAVCQFMDYNNRRSERRNIACRTVYELDLKTLIWTRCPSCGQMQVNVLWSVPT